MIDGEGEFFINDKTINVKKNDVIVVPKNTPYNYRLKKGILKLFLVHTPAYDPKYEIKLNK